MNWLLRILFRRQLEVLRKEIYARTPRIVTETAKNRANMERLMALADLGADHPVWNVVLSYVDEHEQNEMDVALAAGLDDGARQFNTGRAASARDLAFALRDLRIKAETEARRLKGQ